jgi:hypothetical protein
MTAKDPGRKDYTTAGAKPEKVEMPVREAAEKLGIKNLRPK